MRTINEIRDTIQEHQEYGYADISLDIAVTLLAEIDKLEQAVLTLWEVAKIYHADQEYLASSNLRYIQRFDSAMRLGMAIEDRSDND